MTNLMTIHKKGSLNRGRFEKFYEEMKVMSVIGECAI